MMQCLPNSPSQQACRLLRLSSLADLTTGLTFGEPDVRYVTAQLVEIRGAQMTHRHARYIRWSLQPGLSSTWEMRQS